MSDFTLADLAAIIAERARDADPQSSYTAKLLARGVAQTRQEVRRGGGRGGARRGRAATSRR